MMRITIRTLLATALLVAGVGHSPAAPPAAPSLEGTWWRLMELSPAVVDTLLAKTLLPMGAKISFGAGGAFRGADGCQPLEGSWSATGGSITIKPATPLNRACSELVMRQSAAFNAALKDATSYRIDDGRLVLIGAGGEPVAKLSPVTVLPLEGTPWEALRITTEKGATLGPLDDTTLTLAFGPGGTLTGNTGCNQLTGTFTAKDGALTISQPATTRKACPEKVMDQEREFLAALSRTATFLIDEDRLDLIDKAGKRQLVFRGTRTPATPPASP